MPVVVSVAQGGTGANTSAAALTALGAVANTGGIITGNLNVAATLTTQGMVIDGPIAFSGNDYGTAGQVLTSNGSGSPPLWQDPGGLPTISIVSGTTLAAVAGYHYVLTNAAATTVTLPASPAAGDAVWVTVGNGRVDNVINRNSKNINSLAENLTIDNAYAGVQLRYANETLGWIFT